MDGVFSLADGLAHQEKLLKDPDFAPNFCQLVVCTHVTKLARKAVSRRRAVGRALFPSSIVSAFGRITVSSLVASQLCFCASSTTPLSLPTTPGCQGVSVLY